MKKIKLLMIDDNVELIGAVSEYFSSSDKIELTYKAYDGIRPFPSSPQFVPTIDVSISFPPRH